MQVWDEREEESEPDMNRHHGDGRERHDMHFWTRPRFSPVIQLGQIIQAFTFAGSIVGATWFVSAKQTSAEKDIDYAKAAIIDLKQTQNATLQTLNQLTATVARIEGKLEQK